MVFLGSWWIDRCYHYYLVVLFIWEASGEFEVIEELASMNSLCGAATAKNWENINLVQPEMELAKMYYNW